MDEFHQSDEQTAEIEAYEAKMRMKNRKFRARCIQWDKTDADGIGLDDVDAEVADTLLPADVEVTLEDLQLPISATMDEVEDALAIYLTDYYGYCHFGFFFEEVEDWQ